MKKLILVLLLILPFSTFASSLDEVQNLKIEIKWKSINWLSLYNSIEKTLEKKTKWDNNKKLALYKKLLSQTEKSNNDIYKKLSIVLNYWKNETTKSIEKIENKTLDSKYTYIEQFNFYPYYTTKWGEYYPKSKDYIKTQIKSTYERLKDWKNEYNNLTYDILVDDYNTFLSIYKDGWYLNPIFEWSEIKKRLDNIGTYYWYNALPSSLIDSWYISKNWILTYDEKLNKFKNEIKENYIWNNLENRWKLVFERVLVKREGFLDKSNQLNTETLKTDSTSYSWNWDWTAYYWNEWVIRWQWYFSDKEIEEAWQKAFEALSEYEKQRGSANFLWFTSLTLYDKDVIISLLPSQKESINDNYRSEDYQLITKEVIANYNMYLSVFKDWWAINNELAVKAKESFINFLTWKYKDFRTEDEFIISLWYRYENWELVYYDNLNTFKNELKEFEYLK